MDSWALSGALEEHLAQAIVDFERDHGAIDYAFYPSVMWSLGGVVWNESDPDGTRVDAPAEYATGFYKRDPLPEGDGLMFLPSKRFGLIVFLPSDEDRASDRRLVDYAGDAIVVR